MNEFTDGGLATEALLSRGRERCLSRSHSSSRSPGASDSYPLPEFAALVLERVRQDEETGGHRASSTRDHACLGARAVRDQRWDGRPVSREPRRALSPRIAARSKWSRIEAIIRNKAFLDAYLQARALFIKGARDVLFPAGTYWLRRFSLQLSATRRRPDAQLGVAREQHSIRTKPVEVPVRAGS